jgi:hypothetical protein
LSGEAVSFVLAGLAFVTTTFGALALVGVPVVMAVDAALTTLQSLDPRL